jgi:hypothetical protein
MKARYLYPLILIPFVWGCDADAPAPPDPSDPATYHQPTAPESLLANLQTVYKRRDFSHYMELLAPEFVFRFEPLDAADLGTPFWTRDQDSTGTKALLTTNEVSSIRLYLTFGSPDTSINTPGTPVDSSRVRIIITDLQVDQTDGVTWVVTDQQEFYFRKGRAAEGQNPERWFIYEWEDLPTLLMGATHPTPVAPITWGKLKTRYLPQ